MATVDPSGKLNEMVRKYGEDAVIGGMMNGWKAKRLEGLQTGDVTKGWVADLGLILVNQGPTCCYLIEKQQGGNFEVYVQVPNGEGEFDRKAETSAHFACANLRVYESMLERRTKAQEPVAAPAEV